MGVFTPGIDAFAQAAMGVVVIQRLGIAAVAVAEQLTARVPAQVLALFEGIGDLGNTTFRVVLVLCLAPQRVLPPEQIAVAVVAVLPSSPGCIGDLDGQCPMSQVFDVFAAVQGIAGFDQGADIVVAVARCSV